MFVSRGLTPYSLPASSEPIAAADVWDQCFERIEQSVLDDGTPRKRDLQEVNTFFVADALRRRASMDAQREQEALETDG